MTRESLIIILGFLVSITWSLGVPNTYKQYLLIGSGVILMLIGYSLRHGRFLRSIERENGERGTDSFVESSGTRETAEDV